MISGTCAAMAGLIIASELTSAAPQAGETFELNAIAAVVIGGTSLAGGRGNVRGALIGAFVIGFLADGLVILGVSTFWQIVIKGAVIILAVILDQSQQRIQSRGRHGRRAQHPRQAAGRTRPEQQPRRQPAARGEDLPDVQHPYTQAARRAGGGGDLAVAGCGGDDEARARKPQAEAVKRAA